MPVSSDYPDLVMSAADISPLAPVAGCHMCSGSGIDQSFGGECACLTTGGGTLGVTWKPREVAQASATVEIPEGLIEWLSDQKWSTFAQSLVQSHSRTGRLSAKQIASAVSMRAKVQGRESVKPSPAPSALDLTGIPSGCYAVPGGETRLKVRIEAPVEGKWSGWVFVSDAAVYGGGRKYGRQAPGKTYSGDIVEALRAIVADPREAMAEYGRLTETCGLCGRALEDKVSVERGIGPHCAKKAGWL